MTPSAQAWPACRQAEMAARAGRQVGGDVVPVRRDVGGVEQDAGGFHRCFLPFRFCQWVAGRAGWRPCPGRSAPDCRFVAAELPSRSAKLSAAPLPSRQSAPGALRSGGTCARPRRSGLAGSRSGSRSPCAAGCHAKRPSASGSLHVRAAASACCISSTPGRIRPPRKSPAAESRSTVVAVPAVTTRQGPAWHVAGADQRRPAVGAETPGVLVQVAARRRARRWAAANPPAACAGRGDTRGDAGAGDVTAEHARESRPGGRRRRACRSRRAALWRGLARGRPRRSRHFTRVLPASTSRMSRAVQQRTQRHVAGEHPLHAVPGAQQQGAVVHPGAGTPQRGGLPADRHR